MQYLEICLLTTKALGSFNFLFFRVLLLPQQNEIQLVSRFFLSSKPFGPGNWIQSLAMPISVMNARGELTFKSDGDARRLALGCKSRSQILVSLRMFGMERHYLPIQVSLSIVHKKIYKKCPDTDHTEISLTGQFKLEPHLYCSPLGVLLEFSDEHPCRIYMRVPPSPPPPTMNVNSLSCISVMN